MAVVLRVRHLDTTGIWSDQSFTLNTAQRWVNGGPMPLASNKSSAGFINPPMIEYLYALALWLWSDILSVAVLTMISGLVALVAAGWAAYRVFGRRAALWTMLLFAVNPWSVYYSQLIWNQTMVPVFSSLTLTGLLLAFAGGEKSRPGGLIVALVSAACMIQVHPGTLIQLVTIGLICILFWRKLRVGPLLIGGALFVLSWIPFLIFEIGAGWADVKAAASVAGQPAPLSPAALRLSAGLLHAQGLLGSARHVVLFDSLATVLLILALAHILVTGGRALARRADPQARRWLAGQAILLLWFLLPILFYLRSAHYLQIYYLIGQLPAHFLLIGASLDRLQSDVDEWGAGIPAVPWRRVLRVANRALLPLPLLLLAGWQGLFNLQFQDHRFDSTDSVVPQIRHLRATIQTANRLLTERTACDLVVISAGHSVELSQLSLLSEFTDPDRVLLADGRLALPLPSPCAIYLDGLPGSRASLWLDRRARPIPGTAVTVMDGTWSFYELDAQALSDLAPSKSPPNGPIRWANGVSLTGYNWAALIPGHPFLLTLRWVVESAPPEEVYHVGTYLLTADTQVVAQADGPGFDSIQWEAGDGFVTWFEIPIGEDLPPDAVQLAVALYTWPELERVSLTSGGNTAFLERLAVPEE